MPENKSTALIGMKEIADYYGRTEATILYLIRQENFPARKVKGCWESDRELIDQWRKNQLRADVKAD